MANIKQKKKTDSYGHVPRSLMSEYYKSLGKATLYADIHPELHARLYK